MIRLRPAGPDDRDRLRAWRNDPATRRSAFASAEVGAAEHAAWLARRLADPRCVIWIAEEDGVPVGQVRLDASEDAAEVDLALAPEARGRGLSPAVLDLAAAEAPARLGVRRLVAEVKAENEPSLRAFRRAGFSDRGPASGGVVRLEREL